MSDVEKASNKNESKPIVANGDSRDDQDHKIKVEANGGEAINTPAEISVTHSDKSPEFQKLIEYGLDEKVASRLEEIYETGKLTFQFFMRKELVAALPRLLDHQ